MKKRNLFIVILIILASALLSLVACDKPDIIHPEGEYTIEIMQSDFNANLSYDITINDETSSYNSYTQLIYDSDSIPKITLYAKTDLVIRKYYDITQSKKVLIKANKIINL